jgi:hypothetical protein
VHDSGNGYGFGYVVKVHDMDIQSQYPRIIYPLPSLATTRVDAAQRQRSSSAAAVPPPTTTAEATMHAERQLLNNPPPSGALPSTVEQWRHDVDQLIIMSINMPPLGVNHQPPAGHSCTPTPPQAPPTCSGEAATSNEGRGV